MRRTPVVSAALVLLLVAVPIGVAFSAPATPAPAAVHLVGQGAGFHFTTPTYAVALQWPSTEQSLIEGGRVFSGTIDHAGRQASIEQALKVGDVIFEAFDLVDDRFFIIPETTVNADGEPVVTLHVSRTPATLDVGETRGRVTLTFQDDAILHDYEFHLPHVVFTDSVFSTTTLTWSSPYAQSGSVLPNRQVVHDDGASLDPYGGWEQYGTYGVFQQDAGSTLVGHARIKQGEAVNYLGDGLLRVSPTTSSIRTVFTAFLDFPTIGIGQDMLARDAIVFSAADPSTDAYAESIHTLAQGGSGGAAPWFDPASVDEPTPTGPIPHVLVGIPDSGINPYHEIYYRPNLTVHPCTYIVDFPCDIPALPLSVGVYDDWATAYAADKALWDALEYKTWYWIPKTAFVAVMCEGSTNAASATEGQNLCLIDDTNMHGTGTTSSVLTENPNALIAFKEGNSATSVFEDGTLPIDIVSYSWGAAVPLLLPALISTPRDYTPFFVAASGNEGAFPVVLDTPKASQAVINVGAADAATRSEPGYSGWKTADYVSQYCRPTAQTKSISEYRDSYCGTSFSAPTFAGALSKIVLDLRRQSGYTGAIVDQMVDPILGVSKWDVRDALNMTATYTPEARFPAQGGGVPLAEDAPGYQWGWGYVDATIVDATLACILQSVCPTKDAGTVAYMDAMWKFRDIHGGWDFIDVMNCAFSGDAAACDRLPAGLGNLR